MRITAKYRRPGLVYRNDDLSVGTCLPQRPQAWSDMHDIAKGTPLYDEDPAYLGKVNRGTGRPQGKRSAIGIRGRCDHLRES
jgi:hypothetical protein